MGKLILEGTPRTLRDVNGSLYMLVESAQAKIMGWTNETRVMPAVYESKKHKGYYLAGYAVEELEDEPDPGEEQVVEEAIESA